VVYDNKLIPWLHDRNMSSFTLHHEGPSAVGPQPKNLGIGKLTTKGAKNTNGNRIVSRKDANMNTRSFRPWRLGDPLTRLRTCLTRRIFLRDLRVLRGEYSGSFLHLERLERIERFERLEPLVLR
jgi:hypothetical protein